MQTIYMDHSATTPVLPEVVEAMLPYFSGHFGNPSSLYRLGRESKNALEIAREQVAALIGAYPDEIVFTGSGTEADNLAILGMAAGLNQGGKHLITSAIEHHAVLHPCWQLEKMGWQVTYLPVDGAGLISVDDLAQAITTQTALISLMHVNNEVGTIQPLSELACLAQEKAVAMHSDGVQSVGKIPLDVHRLGIDLFSLSAHKLYGPKGIGALYIKRGTALNPIIFGGGQEKKYRPGTENIPAIVGFGKAAAMVSGELTADMARIGALRDKLVSGVFAVIDQVQLNGHPTQRIPGNANISFAGIEGESLLMMLDMKNIAASSGSACMSGSMDPSHVLQAMGLPEKTAYGSVRFTLGKMNTAAEVDYLLQELPAMISRLRAMSPKKDGV